MVEFNFDFKGGVAEMKGGGNCKFLLFLLNGQKEVALQQALKLGFAAHRPADTLTEWSPDAYKTQLNVCKLLVYEDGGFGKEKFSQSFFLALGKKFEKQVINVQPRTTFARARGFFFKAEGSFLKKSEALALLDPESLSAKILSNQSTPPVSVLKEIISIERFGAPKELKVGSHGAVRKLRVR